MILSISSEAADSTAVGLGNGRKIHSFLSTSLGWAASPFRHPKRALSFTLLAGCYAGCSIYNLVRVFERTRSSMPPPPDPTSYESPEGQRPAVTQPIELERRAHDPYAAFRFGGFSLFTAGNLLSITGRLMLAVAVEWELYARTHSATALGLVGLVIAVPVVALSLPAGHLADRFSRKHIILVSQIFSALASLALALVSWKHLSIPPIPVLREGNRALAAIATIFERHHPAFHFDDASIPLIYLLLFIGAIARTFSWAARSSFFPTLVSRDAFANAVTWNNSVFQIGSVVGPGVSGLLVAHIGFPFVYMVDALCAFSFFLLVLPIRRSTQSRNKTEKSTWKSLIAGMRFVLSKKVILATITLDLFAVLLGGATALLPIFADQILHCGSIGLGWMRAAPAVGAFAMALLVAHLPPMTRAGKTLLWCVTGFGIATILFGLSKTFWLSLGLLFFIGAFDSVSVIIRGSIVQLVTPDEMRGRVSAVNNIFIGTSNEFGALESGLTAALFGPVISVVAGGIGTILVVLGVSLRWPETRKIGALDKTLH
jgi:MFS family permease